ncbi:MAG TPA: hypothetical protein PK967_09980 [Candidatus Hydrogenedentes bacterium]|nr:hypothetical protein [Candidatus Hydrogenedentota bacterium]
MRPDELRRSDHTFSRRDAAIAAALFVLASLANWTYLTLAGETPGYRHGDSLMMFVPPALWTMGHGMSEIVPGFYPPALADFLLQKTETLSPEQMPSTPICLARRDKFIYDRIYLLYATGILWRIFGISWGILNWIVSVAGGLTAALAYGIFRLGMTRLISLACAILFVSSPVYLTYLPALRDFCKAPFILGAILATGYLIARRPSGKTLLALACAAGLFTGFGFGFRQDTLIGVPAILAAIAFSPGTEKRRFRLKAAAMAIFVGCFLIPAYPVLRMNRDTGGNNAYYLIQGFAHFMMADADTARSSSVPMLDDHDFYVHAVISHYRNQTQADKRQAAVDAKTGLMLNAAAEAPFHPAVSLIYTAAAWSLRTDLDIWSTEAEQVGRRMVCDLAALYPADIVARWYGAALRCIRGLQGKNASFDASVMGMRKSAALHAPLARHLRAYGVYYAAAAFLAISLHGMRMGLAAAIIPLYFCGYTSLAFQMRHAFHLDFAAYWPAGFLLSLLVRFADGWIRGKSPRAALAAAGLPHAPAGTLVARPILATILLAVLLGAPLYAARKYQTSAMAPIIMNYRNAALEPIPMIQQQDADGRILIAPARMPDVERAWLAPDVFAHYFAIDFECANNRSAPVRLGFRYKPADAAWDREDDLPEWENLSTVRYFFPVFDFSPHYRKNAWEPIADFQGIAVPDSLRPIGFYRVRDLAPFPLLMHVWLPGDPAMFKTYRTLQWGMNDAR